jgi:hypothetical protein
MLMRALCAQQANVKSLAATAAAVQAAAAWASLLTWNSSTCSSTVQQHQPHLPLQQQQVRSYADGKIGADPDEVAELIESNIRCAVAATCTQSILSAEPFGTCSWCSHRGFRLYCACHFVLKAQDSRQCLLVGLAACDWEQSHSTTKSLPKVHRAPSDVHLLLIALDTFIVSHLLSKSQTQYCHRAPKQCTSCTDLVP